MRDAAARQAVFRHNNPACSKKHPHIVLLLLPAQNLPIKTAASDGIK